MTYTYNLTLDESYFRILIARYYQQRPLLLRPPAQLAILGFALVVALAFDLFGRISFELSIAMLLLYALFGAFGLYVIRTLVYQKFRYTSYFGKDSVSTLLDEGLDISGRRDAKLREWSMFKSAVFYPDGIMLIRKGVIWWLPDTALQGAAASDVASFLSAKMPVRRVT